jgi:hypothetical protein
VLRGKSLLKYRHFIGALRIAISEKLMDKTEAKSLSKNIFPILLALLSVFSVPARVT